MKVDNKRYYKKLIEDVLVENGLMNKPLLNKSYIEEVVRDNTQYYLKKKKEEEMEVIDESPVEDEKCSKPKYIQALPGDGRTNDVDILKERQTAIKDGMNEVTDEIDGATHDLDLLEETEGAFYDYFLENWKNDKSGWKNIIDTFEKDDAPRKKEKQELVKEFNNEWKSIKDDLPNNASKENIELYMGDLNKMFNDTSVVSPAFINLGKYASGVDNVYTDIGEMEFHSEYNDSVKRLRGAINKLPENKRGALKDIFDKITDSPKGVKNKEHEYQAIKYQYEINENIRKNPKVQSEVKKYNDEYNRLNKIISDGEKKYQDFSNELKLTEDAIKENS